jgi:hypothetical protein
VVGGDVKERIHDLHGVFKLAKQVKGANDDDEREYISTYSESNKDINIRVDNVIDDTRVSPMVNR